MYSLAERVLLLVQPLGLPRFQRTVGGNSLTRARTDAVVKTAPADSLACGWQSELTAPLPKSEYCGQQCNPESVYQGADSAKSGQGVMFLNAIGLYQFSSGSLALEPKWQ